MPFDDAAGILADADFFDICSEDERRLLAFASERRGHAAGEILARIGEVPMGAHVLISGALFLLAEGAPESQARRVTQRGAVVGGTALMISKPSRVTITMADAGETLLVPRHAFLKLLNQSPQLARRAAERTRRDLLDFMSVVTPFGRKIAKD